MATKESLLEIVQEILSDMDSDEVNSITDTVEAEQVARIVKSTYESLVSQKLIPEHKEVIQLESLSDSSRPNYLRLPINVKYMEVFKYKDEDGYYRDICFQPQEDFLDRVTSRDPTASEVELVNDIHSNVVFSIYNDKRPQYWTSFDDEYIVCDSYDSSVETTLEATNTMAYVVTTPDDVELTDDFKFDLDVGVQVMLKSEAKSMAFSILKTTVNPKVEDTAKRNRRFLQNDMYRTERKSRLKNYGRK